MASLTTSVTTEADGFGRWRAHVEFSHALSENDPRPEFNLAHHWKTIRANARRAIVRELTERERKSHEDPAAAAHRVRSSLPRLVVINQDLDATNCWHGVTLGEP